MTLFRMRKMMLLGLVRLMS